MSETRRHFTAEQKVAILRRHFVEKTPVADLCDEHGVAPSVFYRWQQEFFTNGARAFESPRAAQAEARRREDRVERLQAKLARKDEVIAELMQEHLALKKSLGEA